MHFVGPIVIICSCVDNVVWDSPHIFHSSKSLHISRGAVGCFWPLRNSFHKSLYLHQHAIGSDYLPQQFIQTKWVFASEETVIILKHSRILVK